MGQNPTLPTKRARKSSFFFSLMLCLLLLAFFKKGGINPHQNPTSLIPSCSCTIAKLFLKSATCFYSSWRQYCSLQSWVLAFARCQGKAQMKSLLIAGCSGGAFHPAGSLFHGKSSSLLTRDEVTRLQCHFLTSCSLLLLLNFQAMLCLTAPRPCCDFFWI